MNNEQGGNGFLTGLLVGGIIGVAVGLLYAPRPGTETRAMLMDKTAEARESAAKLMSDAQKKANDILAQARDAAAKLVQKEQE